MNTQLKLIDTYSNASQWNPAPGAVTWHKGRRCVVVSSDLESYAQPMYLVRFADGGCGIFKASELGLRAGEIV